MERQQKCSLEKHSFRETRGAVRRFKQVYYPRMSKRVGVGMNTTVACGIGVAVVIGYALRKRMRAALFWWLQDELDALAWERLPQRIIFLRHGQAEHNLEGGAILTEEHENRKPDNLSELTELGREQARSAGARLRTLLGDGATISVVVSPFERTLQTLYSLQQALGQVRVRHVHVDPRVREQEFGNFQKKEVHLPSSTSLRRPFDVP